MGSVSVVGGGPAGLMAAYCAASRGREVFLLEKNEKLGKKLYITGKGRCNLTNLTAPSDFLENVVTNPKFAIGCIYRFSPEDTMCFFEEGGLKLKVERGSRVFPQSDRASDVTKCLAGYCERAGVNVKLNTCVRKIEKREDFWYADTDGGAYKGESVVICTGGVSYPVTGSTGDGYEFARAFGHKIVPPQPSLVGICVEGDDCGKMQGLPLKNVRLSAFYKEKRIFSEQGEILFTHFGVSGPLVLTLSARINRLPVGEIRLEIDFKPALTREMLDARLLRDFEALRGRRLKNSLDMLLPRAVIPVLISRLGIGGSRSNSEITAAERSRLVSLLKGFPLRPTALRPVEEAIVTAGGVDVSSVHPKTMESRLAPGLFFAGEVLDIDALTGGFNIQMALSTGFAAGTHA